MAEGIIEFTGEPYVIDGDELEDVEFGCPICEDEYADWQDAFACLWNHCGGNWERDKDKDVWVLDFELAEGLDENA